jgi:hypothetical protein
MQQKRKNFSRFFVFLVFLVSISMSFLVFSSENVQSITNQPPIINNITLQGGFVSEYSSLIVDTEDPENDDLTITYSWPFKTNNNTQYFGITDLGDFTTQIKVSDGINEITQDFNFEIRPKVFRVNYYGTISKTSFTNQLVLVKLIRLLTKGDVVITNINYEIGDFVD